MVRLVEDSYEILNQIGSGSYATVHRAINRHTGEICAIKKIPITSELRNLVNEIQIMEECNCKNIVRLYTSTCSDREVSIVMEYCCGGSVKDVMRQLGRTISQEQISVIVKDVLQGLDYLHSRRKVHRDVKAANILLNEAGVAKLGDFGVSEPLDCTIRTPTIIGTPLWLAPEIINQDVNFSPVIDIWSLGITIIEMGDGEPPYSDLDQRAALAEIANLSKASPTFKDPKKWPEHLINLTSLCLEKNSSVRKNAKELLSHDVITKAPSNDIIKSLVAEVCSKSSRKSEIESSLWRRSEQLLRESFSLLNRYRKGRMNVIQFDQKTSCFNSKMREFFTLYDNMMHRIKNYEDIRDRSKKLKDDIAKLEGEKNDLKDAIDKLEKRKEDTKFRLSQIVFQTKSYDDILSSSSGMKGG